MKPVAVFVREAAETLGLSRQAAWRRMRRGDFGPVRQLPGGGRLFVLRQDFDRAIEAMAVEDPPEREPSGRPRPRGIRNVRNLPEIPKHIEEFMDGKPKRRGQKATTPNGRTRWG